MTNPIAKFSNGHTDEYKGKRNITAAWMIVRKSDGEVLDSGHSLDDRRAKSTASNNLTYHATNLGVTLPKFDIPARLYMGCSYTHLYRRAADHGYKGGANMSIYKKWAKAKNAERKAQLEAAAKIEVVAL